MLKFDQYAIPKDMANSIKSAPIKRLTLVRRHKRRNKPTFIFFLRRKLRLDAIGRTLLLLLCQDDRVRDSVLLLLLGGDGRLRTLKIAGAPNPSPSRLSSRQRAVVGREQRIAVQGSKALIVVEEVAGGRWKGPAEGAIGEPETASAYDIDAVGTHHCLIAKCRIIIS